MKTHLISSAEAASSLAKAAASLAENIRGSDGQAEALKEIAAYFAEKGEVDLAAELADTINDNFVRDNLLVKIAEKCQASGDEEYAFQLAEAIEDYGLQSTARERIAIQKVARGDFQGALTIAEKLSHPDEAFAAIAVRQMNANQETDALKTLSRIEYPAIKVQALQTIALHFYEKDEKKKAAAFLTEAIGETKEIELPEEKIRALLAVAGQFIEAAQFDKAIEVLGQVRSATETLDSVHRESFLSAAALDFLRAGSIDLADHTLDLIADKTQIASTLVGFSAEFDHKGEHADALDALEEAYANLKSQKDKEVRDSRLRFNLLNVIAIRFAALGKIECGIETAVENPIASERDDALMHIALDCEKAGNDELLRQSVDAIADEDFRTFAFINLSNAANKTGEKDKALSFLDKAVTSAKNVTQPSARSAALNEIIKRFFEAGKSDAAREIAFENLQIVKQISDESLKAIALLHLGEIYESCGFELNDAEREILSRMIRQPEW